MDELEHRDWEQIGKILHEALTYDKPDRPALVARIPVICNDIRDIKNSLWWISRIASVIGMGLLALVTALISAGQLKL